MITFISKKAVMIAIIIICPFFLFATNYTVSLKTDLIKKMTLAKPGDTVIVQDGTYNWGQIAFTNLSGSSTSAWIVLKSQTFNGVVFTGNTYLQFGGYHLLITGFKFANGTAGLNDVIQFRGGSGGNVAEAYYCRINNITIDNYNSDSTGCTSTPTAITDTLNRWVSFYGRHNRMDHCTFINKYNGGPTVAIMYDSSNYPIGGYSTYHLIDSNYFKNRGWQGGNEGETIRIGLGSMSNNDGYNVVEHNLFQYGTSTDPEIISNKSNLNTYRYNTFKDLDGGITMRQGRYNSVYGNFIIKTTPNSVSTNQYGIRLIDKGHKVYNNYIEGINSNYNSTTASIAPIIIYSGQVPGEGFTIPIPGYYSADSCIVAFNSIVNCYGGVGIQIGYNHANKGSNAAFKPQGLIIANNAIKMSKGQAIGMDTTTSPYVIDTVGGHRIPDSLPVKYFSEGNIYNAAKGLGFTNTTGFTSKTLTFGSRINGVLTAPTVLKDAAINSLNYDSLLNGVDAFGVTRSATYDVGAVEANGTGVNINIPLDSSMVGAGMPVSILPISIISFTGVDDRGFVTLKWQVNNELNIESYFVEYSSNGSDFNSIGQVNSQNKGSYQQSIQEPNAENNYYRLRILSKDGTSTYSNIVLISKKSDAAQLSLFPNPSRGNLTIMASHIQLNAKVLILDYLGRTLQTQPLMNGMNAINVAGLNSGSYRISLIENGKVSVGMPFMVGK